VQVFSLLQLSFLDIGRAFP